VTLSVEQAEFACAGVPDQLESPPSLRPTISVLNLGGHGTPPVPVKERDEWLPLIILRLVLGHWDTRFSHLRYQADPTP